MMKVNRNVMTFILFSVTLSMFSQITKLKLGNENSDVKKSISYDSLTNIDAENALQQVGQTLYLKESKYYKEQGGYFALFCTKPDFYATTINIYKPVQSKKDKNDYVCDYNSIAGKYFYVNNIIPKNNSNCDEYFLELIETETKDTVYLHTIKHFDKFNNFITLGYFEKIKKLYIGQEFYFLDNSFGEGLRDINNKTRRNDIPEGTKLKCLDVSLEEGEYNEIIVIFENPKYGKSFMYLKNILHGHKEIETSEEHQKTIIYNNTLKKKYGQQNAELIIKGKVKIGFTKQMCIEAWGKPEEINKTTGSYGTDEQWVYSNNNYLYFRNGILKTIQN